MLDSARGAPFPYLASRTSAPAARWRPAQRHTVAAEQNQVSGRA